MARTEQEKLGRCLMPAKVLLALVLVFTAAGLKAEEKKDVTDPVLQEVIANFTTRMPRFIDKHGQSVFVADSPVTRGALMMALYEYDRSLKLPKKDFVTRQEFDELRGKLALSEKPAAQEKAVAPRYDLTQIINDLLPNMPILLDNSLEYSKVFLNLREEVKKQKTSGGAVAGGSVSADMWSSIHQSQRDIVGLARRIEEMEKKQTSPVAYAAPKQGGGKQGRDDSSSDTRRELAKLQKRVDELEENNASRSYAGGEVKGYTSALTKITLGLGMVAAFFMAR